MLAASPVYRKGNEMTTIPEESKVIVETVPGCGILKKRYQGGSVEVNRYPADGIF